MHAGDSGTSLVQRIDEAHHVAAIGRLISLDRVWTTYLSDPASINSGTVESVRLVGEEMRTLLSMAPAMASGLRCKLATSPELYETRWASLKESGSIHDEDVSRVVDSIESQGGIVAYLEACAEGLAATWETEAADLRDKLAGLMAGRDTAGDLSKSGQCFLLGAGFGAALGTGNAIVMLAALGALANAGCV